MRLLPNWKAVLRYAWSIRFIALAAALSGAEVALPLIERFLPIPAGIFAALSFVTVAAAFIARIIAQRRFPMASRRARSALASGLGLIALTVTYLTLPWEGMENRAYWDRLGQVWTICAGEPKGVTPGMVMTDEECSAKLYERMERDYANGRHAGCGCSIAKLT